MHISAVVGLTAMAVACPEHSVVPAPTTHKIAKRLYRLDLSAAVLYIMTEPQQFLPTETKANTAGNAMLTRY